ncbi:uncharacterized protein HNR44_002697 [Geomicrobium halophilum]|uniref:DUF418 domain-containing protein n=1 Tax=Geomicrobium halophilum TaxID=549000 RepID=A0A841PPE5_9BACL|nr:DUF418 domain-containing protein [Geomicrobium halophilum]MBB6450707.1 uncharacterized protein [Geomicrobium halophilum]
MKAAATVTQERIHSLDIIRGIAVFGILIANMAIFKSLVLGDARPTVEGGSLPDGAFNQFASLFNTIFVEGKFYPMFSLLFGLGFFIFYSRLVEKDLNANRVFVRRLVFLLVIGLIHLIFLWSGDILHTYALAGFLLLLFVDRRPQILILWIVVLLGVSSLFMTVLLAVTGYVNDQFTPMATFEEMVVTGTQIMSEGSYGEILTYRFFNEVLPTLFESVFTVAIVLPLFLIGLYMGKTGMFHHVDRHLKRWKKLCIHSLWSGGLLTILMTALHYDVIPFPSYITYGLSMGVNVAAGPLLMLFYVSGLVLFLRSNHRRRLLMPFAAVGRMALTNYLLQTIVAIFIFYGFGLGLFGHVSSGTGLLIAIGIYIAQMILSNLYLQTFTQGPVEALWRKWTYKGKTT